MKKVGIDSISFYVPNIYLSIQELSLNRDLEFEKLNKGLGLNKMSIPDIDEDPATFAANALIDLIEKNNINLKSIGRIYMGTESALDSSKPTCTYATELVEKYFEPKFGKRCLKNCDVSDITFACIGGVDALQNSLDWVSNNHGKKAIVVCSDLSKYELNSTGEYTQGAGAVALLVSEDPSIISIKNQWGVATKSEKDFFKPRRTFHKKELINEIIKKLELNFATACSKAKFKIGISKIKQFGIFFEVHPLYIEGFLPLSELHGDYYHFQPKSQSLIGQHSGRVYSVGHQVEVTLTDINLIFGTTKWNILEKGTKKKK